MDNRKYCLVVNGNIEKYNLTRNSFGVGINSSESACVTLGYYLVIDNAPVIDTSIQRISGSSYVIDEVTKTVTKAYTVIDISLQELTDAKNKLVETTVQTMLDTAAKAKGYDSIISACSYTGSVNFGTDALSFLTWRDSVWAYVFKVQADILAGTRTEPILDALMLELATNVVRT